jgi:predicted ferric reductase
MIALPFAYVYSISSLNKIYKILGVFYNWCVLPWQMWKKNFILHALVLFLGLWHLYIFFVSFTFTFNLFYTNEMAFDGIALAFIHPNL